MKRRTRNRTKRQKSPHPQIPWLPFDSRLIPDIFSFSRVRGVARIFLLVEIVLSVLVVSISLGLVLFTLFF